MSYAELCTTSNFSFLTGASHPEELVTRAAKLGLPAIAITDHNSLAGVVRGWSALQELKRIGTPDLPKLITGCRLVLQDSDAHWLALPTDRPAYARLSRLLTLGKRRAEKGQCHLYMDDLLEGGEGLTLIGLPQAQSSQRGADEMLQQARRLTRRFPGNTFLGAAPR